MERSPVKTEMQIAGEKDEMARLIAEIGELINRVPSSVGGAM